MASEAVNNYITKRYERWLDYSLYHCGLAGISDEATDVLNEVICSLLQKKSRLLDKFQQESESVTEQPVKIPFDFTNRDSIPKGKDPGDCIVIKPITVRTWFRIRPLLLEIEKEDIDKMIVKDGELNADFPELMNKYGGLLLDVVCLGIHNKPSDPPAWFKKALIDNTTWEDIRILFNAIIYRIGYHPFCTSITMLRNVSPLRETEIIAARKNLQSWKDITKADS